MANLTSCILSKHKTHTPIWFMRQAGRYLPEYMKIRENFTDFLEMCYSPQAAAEITIQPISRFDFDAAILFSDILVVPDVLGMKVWFEKDHGPKLNVIKSKEDISKLRISNDNRKFESISQAIKIIRSDLKKENDLIGFAGSPWTILTYMVEEDRKNQFNKIRAMIYENPNLIQKMLDIITEQTISYLKMQIESGVNVLQLFDSWAGVLREDHYFKYVIEPTKKIVESIKSINNDMPIIGFPKGSGILYNEYIRNTGVDAISVDHLTNLKMFDKEGVCIQGNLDPVLLTIENKGVIKNEVEKVLRYFENKRHIFNLGHGILPNTLIDNVHYVIDCVRGYRKITFYANY